VLLAALRWQLRVEGAPRGSCHCRWHPPCPSRPRCEAVLVDVCGSTSCCNQSSCVSSCNQLSCLCGCTRTLGGHSGLVGNKTCQGGTSRAVFLHDFNVINSHCSCPVVSETSRGNLGVAALAAPRGTRPYKCSQPQLQRIIWPHFTSSKAGHYHTARCKLPASSNGGACRAVSGSAMARAPG
jgi:hypothetical protein